MSKTKVALEKKPHMTLTLKIEIVANGYSEYRAMVNEAIRQLAISNEYTTQQNKRTETGPDGTFTISRDCRIEPMRKP